jgi:hypothetical protein
VFYVLTLPSRANNRSVLESLFPPDQHPELRQGSKDGHCGQYNYVIHIYSMIYFFLAGGDMKEMLGDIVKSCYENAQEQQKAEGHIKQRQAGT